MKLVFATNNKNKLEEIRKIIPSALEILSLKEIGCDEELPETGNTLEQNAAQKARYIFDKYGYACFADDSGLEVDALHGRPGVYSARYAGPQCNHADNIRKLLGELNHEENRKAGFRTVIALMMGDNSSIHPPLQKRWEMIPHLFEGEIKGEITLSPRGEQGFGYDPVFVPEGFHTTFAEMLPELKNRISHRAQAVKKLVEFLSEIRS